MITTSMGDSKDGPFILNCNYCMWNTLDIGIKFDKPTGLRQQLDEIANGGSRKPSLQKLPSYQDGLGRKSSLSRPPLSQEELEAGSEDKQQSTTDLSLDATSRFNALRTFYKDQIAESSATDASFPTSALDIAYSSPSSLQRIMNIYTNRENSLKRARQKLTIMREARTTSEGLQLPAQSAPGDYDETTTSLQRTSQYPSFIGNPRACTVSELRPMPTLMRTKRSKRCATCKHILTRPELKISSARYRIKLIALSYVPFVSIRPLPVTGGLLPSGPDGSDVVLSPGRPVQFIMTLRNPLFDDVNVSLGSPSITPGKHGHRVTILCPQFQIGKNSDAWDDALNTVPKPTPSGDANTAGGEQIAGKLYDQGRNWASVVIEIIPASIFRKQGEELDEDEDVVEIPIRVRLEWTVTEDADTGIVERRRREREKVLDEDGEADDGKRELSYWMVLGIGRVDC
jgi:dynactin-4